MKTTRILLVFGSFLLFPWCAAQLSAQQNEAQKIVITKRTVDADGSESTETIVKKGDAAKNFDLDKYLRENRASNAQIKVKVTGDDDERTIVINGAKKNRQNEADEDEDEEDVADNEDEETPEDDNPGYTRIYNGGLFPMSDNKAFLGVDEDSDEKANEPGLVVNVVRGSAADKAGLHDNDKILKLNDTPTNKWSDLSKFVQRAKVGDNVRITYERYGKTATTEATLTKPSDVKCASTCSPKGFLGVSDDEEYDEKDEAGVVVRITKGSGAEKAGLQNGDIIFQLGDAPIADFEDISDVMAYTKPGEKINLVYERNGKRNTVVATLGDEKDSWNLSTENWNQGNWSSQPAWEQNGSNQSNCTVNVRAKDACLGVFSDASTMGKTEGSRITDFTENSPALEAKLEKGDVITAVNGKSVKNHDDLWNEIAQYKIGDKVTIDYLRDGKANSASATLKACQDNSSRVEIWDNDGQEVRNFLSWNWNDDDQRRLRERSIITIRKGEGDAAKVNALPNGLPAAQDRSLKLRDFRAFPNPTQGQVTVEFTGEPQATTVSFFDLSGRQLFREELNAFNGRYSQQFDLSEYAKGTIIVHVQQGEKVFTEQVIVN